MKAKGTTRELFSSCLFLFFTYLLRLPGGKEKKKTDGDAVGPCWSRMRVVERKRRDTSLSHPRALNGQSSRLGTRRKEKGEKKVERGRS